MSRIAVSVIVPIYNVEKYLDECLESLEQQTFKSFEVILVNDGSTDSSGEIARKYVKKNRNFSLIEKENGGLSDARNAGIEKATGEYIYFLDSDDFLEMNTIEILYEKVKTEDLDVLKFSAYVFEDADDVRDYCWTTKVYKYKGEYPIAMGGIEALQQFVNYQDMLPSCCLMISKRNIINENNIRFLEGIIFEDNLFQWELLSVSGKVAVLNEPLYYRRCRGGSITQTPDLMKRIMSFSRIVKEADKFVTSHPQIEGKTTEWYIMSFLESVLSCWNQMRWEQRKCSETKEYIKSIKPIARKYRKGSTFYTKLFFTSKLGYVLFRQAVIHVKRLLGR